MTMIPEEILYTPIVESSRISTQPLLLNKHNPVIYDALDDLYDGLQSRIEQPSYQSPILVAFTGNEISLRPNSPLNLVPKNTPLQISPQSGGGSTGIAGLFLPGLAAGFGAYLGYKAQDWFNLWKNNRQPPQPFEDNSCRPEDLAQSYLTNLQRDDVDQRLKSIPPRTFRWQMPNGYSVEVQQGWSKDGLIYKVKLKGLDGSTLNKEFKVNVEATHKGAKIPLFEAPLVVGGENFGKLSLDLRVNSAGLDEVGLTFTSHDGYLTKLKLKPGKRCDLDVSSAQLLRMNQGFQADAKKWAEVHLAESAQRNGGNLYPGLLDLLIYIQPSANGIYRNHGSPALGVLTTALNQLQQAGVDLSELQAIQTQAQAAKYGSADYKKYRHQAEQWLQRELQQTINQGKIDPASLRNPYEINFGVTAIQEANKIKAQPTPSPVKINPDRPQLQITFQQVKQAAGNQYVVTQTRSGDLFVATPFVVDFKNNQGINDLLDRLAKVLGVNRDQIEWFAAKLTIRGVQTRGILIRAHAQ